MKRHSRFLRFLSRLCFVSLKLPIIIISYFHHRPYMALYVPLLRLYGMRFDGVPRYIASSVYFDDLSAIQLAERVVISTGVKFLTHDYSITTASIACGIRPLTDIATVRGIVVGRNVFIGLNSIVMPGTKINDNVIIGAGSVVRGKIESGTVLLGNPATRVRNIEDHFALVSVYLNDGSSRKD